MPFDHPNACKHGRLRRSCNECDSEEEIAALREYLRVYGGHIHPCPGRPCECGFAKAWEYAGLPATTREGQA